MALSDNTYEVAFVHCVSEQCERCDTCTMFYRGVRTLESERHVYLELGADCTPCTYYRDNRSWVYRASIATVRVVRWAGIIVSLPVWAPIWLIGNIICESTFTLTPEQIGKLAKTNIYTAHGLSWRRDAVGGVVAKASKTEGEK